MIRKAVVLAAGHGTRLRPFTCATPKPVLPVWGETMISRIVRLLRERGVDDIVVNAHHLNEQVRAWVDNYRRNAQAAGDKVRIKLSYEPEILGNGGVLNPLREWIGEDPFYLVNSDIVMENVPDLAVQFEKMTSSSVIGCALVTASGPRTVEVEPESKFITCWKSPDPGVEGTYTYCGFAILKPEILAYVKPDGFSSIVTAYEKAMMEGGKFVKSVVADDLLWEDAGTIASYIGLNSDGEDNAFADIPQIKATGATNVRFLGARGSERVFFGCDQGIVVLYDDGNRDENGKYPGHARWLKAHGIPVPEILADIPTMKTMLMSNAGEERKMSVDDYAKVVETLAKFGALGSEKDLPDLLPQFDDETWEWERNLFAKYCLGANFQMEMPAAVRAELESVAEILEKEPKALVHRDFQSTNVLWKGDALAFIDFQGMRLGPAAYDLASLVYDPYVKFTDDQRRALVALYAKAAGREEFVKVLPFAAVQRLVQCLGAYGRLASVGQPQFGKHVLPALENLLDAADKAGLDAVGALCEDLINREMKKEKSRMKNVGDHHCTCGHHH